MSELNELEVQLRSWVPRRPSAKLKKKLFRAEATAPEPTPSLRLSWLPPATAAALLLCVLFNQHSSQALSSSGANSIVAVALSNQSIAPWLPGSFPREYNGLPTGKFEWTNRNSSSIGSRPLPSATN